MQNTQVPYWVAVLTPEERPFGTRRTDGRIDAIDDSVVTSTRTQWAGASHPSATMLLAVLAATTGSWQSDRCCKSTSGILVDLESDPEDLETDRTLFPVRLPTTGEPDALTAEVQRRIAAAPSGGRYFAAAATAPALARKHGAQIAFRFGGEPSTADSDPAAPLRHSLTVTCDVTEVDGVVFVDTAFTWNCRVFSQADVDDFERYWEKTISTFS
ncbi:MAG: hypothetical protein WBQ44_04670 [Rhodococcus sp. (in: high G+C Gram-positive bacteria)]